ATAVEVIDSLVVVSTTDGIRVVRIDEDRTLRSLWNVDAETLGGAPGALLFHDDSLWVALPQQHEVVQIELASGQFEVVRRVQTSDLTGNELSATDLHIEQDTLFVSSGRSAKVVAFALRKQSDVLPVG